jgi:hypothetical protein
MGQVAALRAESREPREGAPSADAPFQAESFVKRVQAELTAFLKARPGKASQSGVAKSIGMSATVVSQFQTGQYKGDVLHVAHMIDNWLMLQVRRADQLIEPVYVETRIGAWIHEGLEMAMEMSDVAMVYGAAGLGKTRTGKQFRDERGGAVVFITATPARRSPHGLLEALGERLGVVNTSTIGKMQTAIEDKLRGSGRLLIVDEAERLTFRSLETLQSIHDETNVGLALLADEVLWQTITAGRSRAEHARFLSRVGIRRPVNPGVGQDDVEKIAVQFLGHRDEECIAYLTAKAQGVGGFRAVVKHCRLASRIARIENRKLVEVRDLEIASITLGDGGMAVAE